MSLPTVTVTATYKAPDGTPARGRLLFRLTAPLVDVNDNVLVPASTATVTLDETGGLTHALVPSDAAGIIPAAVPYEITEQVPGGRVYQLLIPSANPTVRLGDLAPLIDPVEVVVTVDRRDLDTTAARAAALSLIMGSLS